LASLPLLHFSHSISSNSRSYHAKLHPRVCHDLLKRELQAIVVPGPSFHIENITSPALLHVAYELARISSVSRQIGHPYSSPPTHEGTARNCGPQAVFSCPVPPSSKSHSISPESYPFRARLHTRVRHCLLKRGTQEIISPGLPFRVLQITFPSNKSLSISPDSCPFHFQLHTGVHQGLGKRGTQEIAVPGLSSRV
jgi:hypothetical protein